MEWLAFKLNSRQGCNVNVEGEMRIFLWSYLASFFLKRSVIVFAIICEVQPEDSYTNRMRSVGV